MQAEEDRELYFGILILPGLIAPGILGVMG
jgi:hypothetical protein